MDAKKLARWLEDGRKFVLLDVLPKEAFEELRLPGAANACVYEMTFLDQVAAHVTDREAPIVVYGSGPGSRDAADARERLEAAGYRDVHVFAGGRQEWLDGERPCEGARAGETWVPDPPRTPPDGDFTVDLAKSVVEWAGRNPGGGHWGTLRFSQGSIAVRDGRLEKGEFDIDLKTIEVGDLEGDMANMLVAHLESDDFFAVARHPAARLEITAAVPIEEATAGTPNVAVEGSLELRGERRSVRFPASVLAKEGGIALDAHFDLDRTRWGVNYGSGKLYHRLGMHLVDDAISLNVRLFAS